MGKKLMIANLVLVTISILLYFVDIAFIHEPKIESVFSTISLAIAVVQGAICVIFLIMRKSLASKDKKTDEPMK